MIPIQCTGVVAGKYRALHSVTIRLHCLLHITYQHITYIIIVIATPFRQYTIVRNTVVRISQKAVSLGSSSHRYINNSSHAYCDLMCTVPCGLYAELIISHINNICKYYNLITETKRQENISAIYVFIIYEYELITVDALPTPPALREPVTYLILTRHTFVLHNVTS